MLFLFIYTCAYWREGTCGLSFPVVFAQKGFQTVVAREAELGSQSVAAGVYRGLCDVEDTSDCPAVSSGHDQRRYTELILREGREFLFEPYEEIRINVLLNVEDAVAVVIVTPMQTQ